MTFLFGFVCGAACVMIALIAIGIMQHSREQKQKTDWPAVNLASRDDEGD